MLIVTELTDSKNLKTLNLYCRQEVSNNYIKDAAISLRYKDRIPNCDYVTQ